MIETYENQLEQICLLHAGQSEAQLVLRHAAQYAEDILFHENSGGNDKPKSETFLCVVDACVLLQLANEFSSIVLGVVPVASRDDWAAAMCRLLNRLPGTRRSLLLFPFFLFAFIAAGSFRSGRFFSGWKIV
jgi:hypothetical protein